MINPFTGVQGAYDNITLTGAINRVPSRYDRVSRLGIFQPAPVTTKVFSMDDIITSVLMLNPVPTGGTVPMMGNSTRKHIGLETSRYPLDFVIRPSDIQGVRAWGSEADETYANVLTRKMESKRASFDQTAEYLRVGAIKGVLKNPDGTTVYDFFQVFNVTPKVINFALGNGATNVGGKCREVARWMEDNLLGESFSGLVALCGPTFWEALVTHASVKENFLNVIRQQDIGVDDYRIVGFLHQGIRFIEYAGRGYDSASGSLVNFIEPNEAHVVPIGTSAFQEVYSPPDHIDWVNTPGQYMYTSSALLDHGQGVSVRSEMNILPWMRTPQLLVKLTNL